MARDSEAATSGLTRARRRGGLASAVSPDEARSLALSLREAVERDHLVERTFVFLHRPEPANNPGELSPRRREVLQLLAEGHTMKEIARILKITPRTVAFHKYGMMEELGLRTNAKLIQYAFQRQLVPA